MDYNTVVHLDFVQHSYLSAFLIHLGRAAVVVVVVVVVLGDLTEVVEHQFVDLDLQLVRNSKQFADDDDELD
jgi:hypothetical protein